MLYISSVSPPSGTVPAYHVVAASDVPKGTVEGRFTM